MNIKGTGYNKHFDVGELSMRIVQEDDKMYVESYSPIGNTWVKVGAFTGSVKENRGIIFDKYDMILENI